MGSPGRCSRHLLKRRDDLRDGRRRRDLVIGAGAQQRLERSQVSCDLRAVLGA
jgi:hypothetical protein